SIGSVGCIPSSERYFLPPQRYCTKPKNIPTAAKEKPPRKLKGFPNKLRQKPSLAQRTNHRASADPKLIPNTKMLKPASRLRSSNEYKPPTISETLGLSKPVPTTINAIEIYRPNSAIGKAKIMCPIIMRTPPKKTVLRAPQI